MSTFLLASGQNGYIKLPFIYLTSFFGHETHCASHSTLSQFTLTLEQDIAAGSSVISVFLDYSNFVFSFMTSILHFKQNSHLTFIFMRCTTHFWIPTGWGTELGITLLTRNYPARIIPKSIDYHCKILHNYDMFDILFSVIHDKVYIFVCGSYLWYTK